MQYAARLEQSPAAQSILSACKNSVVHSFLRHRLQELNGKEISSSFDVTLAPVAGIPDTDLIIALGNLLDNAVEACTAAQERRIRLTVRQKDGYIQIETENTCAPGHDTQETADRVSGSGHRHLHPALPCGAIPRELYLCA